MNAYDPDKPVDPEEWLKIEEEERILLVEAYHKKAKIELPNPEIHAVMHCVVENQLAVGDGTTAKDALGRLLREGLTRHEAIHAIATVLSGRLYEHQTTRTEWDSAAYNRELDELTAQAWLNSGSPDETD